MKYLNNEYTCKLLAKLINRFITEIPKIMKYIKMLVHYIGFESLDIAESIGIGN